MISDNVEFLPPIFYAVFWQPSKIQHCSISSKFDMWVDYDVPNLFPTLKNFYRFPFSKWPKWRSVEIFQCQESIRDIIIYPHIKCWWYRTMLNFYCPFFMPCFERGSKSYFEGFKGGRGYYRILWKSWIFVH
jgi:hypothetical protein